MNDLQVNNSERLSIKDGLSIDEAKVSVLIIVCALAFLYAFVMYAINGDISDNLTLIIQTLVCTIGGVNITGAVAAVISKRK